MGHIDIFRNIPLRIHKNTIKDIIILNGTPIIIFPKAKRVKHYINVIREAGYDYYQARKLGNNGEVILFTELKALKLIDSLTKGQVIPEYITDEEIKQAEKIYNQIDEKELLNTLHFIKQHYYKNQNNIHLQNKGYYLLTRPTLRKYDYTYLVPNKHYTYYRVFKFPPWTTPTSKYLNIFKFYNYLIQYSTTTKPDKDSVFYYEEIVISGVPTRIHPNYPRTKGKTMFVRTKQDFEKLFELLGEQAFDYYLYLNNT